MSSTPSVKDVLKSLETMRAFGIEVDPNMVRSAYEKNAADVLENKSDLDSDGIDRFVSEAFALAESFVSEIHSRETGGQGGGSKKSKHDVGFDTPFGHLYISVTV